MKCRAVWIGLALSVVMFCSAPVGAVTPDASAPMDPAGFTLYLPMIVHEFPLVIADISFVTPQMGWAAVNTSILQTTDGSTWHRQATIHQPIDQLDFVSPTTGWLIADGRLYRSTDAGVGWEPMRMPADTILFARIDFVDSSFGWALDYKLRLWETRDGATSWQQGPAACGDGFEAFPTAIFLLDRSTMWQSCVLIGLAGLRPNDLYQTMNGGMTWTLVNSLATMPPEKRLPAYSSIREIVMRDATRGGLVFNDRLTPESPNYQGFLLLTDTAWQAWDGVESLPPGALSGLTLISDTEAWLISRRVRTWTLWQTRDQGRTWTPVDLATGMQ